MLRHELIRVVAAMPAAVLGDFWAGIWASLPTPGRRMSGSRKLAAIRVADVVGYSRLATLPPRRYGRWIPAFWVPALLVTHFVVFVLLGRRWYGPM
jgi:hypothetical protein